MAARKTRCLHARLVSERVNMKNNIYLWTGNGWGKTTSAIGAALRAIGHGYKVIIIQFMKGRKDKIGEYKIRKKLGNKYEIYQFGREGWVDLKKPSLKDKILAQKGLEAAKQAVKKKPFLLVLDEVNLAARIGLVDTDELVDFLDKIPKSITVYLTGRNAPRKLKKKADYINKIKMIKGPKALKGKKGIDY